MHDNVATYTQLFRLNWQARHDPEARWRRIHRYYARAAVAGLRFLTGRQRKRFGPVSYGQPGLL